MRSTVVPSSSTSSASVAGTRRSGLVRPGSSSSTSTSHRHGHACERRAHVRDRVEAFRRVDRGLGDRPQAPHPVDPERAEVVAQVVVRGEVPAPRVDDEAVRAQLAARLVARERTVRAPDSTAPPDDVGEEEHGVAAHGRAPARTRREVECRLERLHAAPQPVRQHAVDLHERAVDRLGRAGQPEPSRRLDAERDGHRLVVREHERRQPVSRPDPVARRRHRAAPRPECRASAAPRRTGVPFAGRSRADRRSRGP